MYEAHTRTLTLTRTREWAVRGHVKKNGRRPSWTERDARHGKLGKTMYEAHTRTRTLTRTRERAVRGHVKKRRRPSWTERDARHAKLGKTTYEAHARTRTRERAVRGHGKKRPTPVVDGTGRAPWKTGQNHVRGTHTYTDPYTDP